jgi:hypothetical protein
MEKQLDFPYWTRKEIEDMPLTLLKSWSDRNSVPMDRGYLRETNRKDYFIAGRDIPALSRDELNVFAPVEWEKEKSNLIYERWVEEAKRRIGR